MKRLAAVVLVAAFAAPDAQAARPLSGSALLRIDRAAGFRNFLPTRMLSGFTYSRFSYAHGVLRVDFVDRAGWTIQWRVGPMSGNDCSSGMQQSFQLDGNKVWWAQNAAGQFAWRCEFGVDGKALRLEAASSTPPSKLGPTGLGVVAASAKRY